MFASAFVNLVLSFFTQEPHCPALLHDIYYFKHCAYVYLVLFHLGFSFLWIPIIDVLDNCLVDNHICVFITWTALQYLYYNLGASSLPTKYCTICYASHGNERLICGWSNKLIITAKSQASSSNYKIAQASKKLQIPDPFSLSLLRKYEMAKWLTFNLYCIHIRKKEITVTILTFIYTMDQISSSLLMNYWTWDYINRKHLCTLILRGRFSGS